MNPSAEPRYRGNEIRSLKWTGYLWSAAGIACATGLLWLSRNQLDKGQASLLYLPAVIACAIRFGFGPSVLAAVMSFVGWDYFFLPPRFTVTVRDPKDWLSLIVFLVAAITTARLASRALDQAAKAREREAEILTLLEASETVSREIESSNAIRALANQLQVLCRSSLCIVWRLVSTDPLNLQPMEDAQRPAASISAHEQTLAEATAGFGLPIGFDSSSTALWSKAIGGTLRPNGVYVPLVAEQNMVGVIHVGPRGDGRPFTETDKRLILTLANHAAVVIARDTLAQSAAQAEALREADALKDALLSMVSHELQSPLAAIKATATSLRRDLGDSAAEEIGAINSEADRLSSLVGNLLDLSRLEAGAWKPERDWCDVGEILGTALDRLRQRDADRVTVAVSPDLPLIMADYMQITIVLTNIIENAAKYSRDPSPIEVAIQPVLGEDRQIADKVMVQVRDFGAGITQGNEETIFNRFFRGDVQIRSAVRGSGLGLAICRAIVSAHGGRIWAANAPEGEPKGAVFTIILPTQ